MTLDLDPGSDPGSGPGLALRPTSKNLSLRNTGFKGVILASGDLSLRRPRIGYARLLIARNMPNHSTIPDFYSVITLGQHVKQPLIWPPSELADGFEPHVHI